MSIIIPALPFKQHKTQMYLAAVSPDILNAFSIDIWNSKNVVGRRGYQRKPDESRIKSIAKYLERSQSIMPVAGLLNVREKGRLKYQNGKLTIPDGLNVWVVDMQHRLKGLVQAYEDGGLPTGSFHFPVVITEGLNQVGEAAQFYLINTKAKKMDVALTRRILIENNKVRDIADVKPWEIAAVRITIEMNKSISRSPWFESLRQPNEDKSQQHIATEKSFVQSLRQLLIAGRYKQPKKAAKKLAAYWRAIEENIPEAFHEPRRFLIQKTSGMFAFNFFLAPMVFARYKENEFEKALKGLKRLGPNFWRRSNKRGARRFGTGMGGYSNLADYLKSELC
ncbi:MAG TPA: DGQHR domain-containing protein [Candidatus Acidoferrales bacterium]